MAAAMPSRNSLDVHASSADRLASIMTENL
jgi:hypothetical protein